MNKKSNDNVIKDFEQDHKEFSFDKEGGVDAIDGKPEKDSNSMKDSPIDQWSIQGIWNDIDDLEFQRKPKKRTYISAGDVGKEDYWSRYMKMRGVPPTNPIPNRVFRIFQAGDVFHDFIKKIFKVTGLFINSEDDWKDGKPQWSVTEPTEDKLEVRGKYDILVGGTPDLDAAIEWIENSNMSDFARMKAKRIAKYFAHEFKNGLRPLLYEVKSINSNAFWHKRRYLEDAYPHHKLQLFHYLQANDIHEGRLLYVSKDDMVVEEFPVFANDQKLKERYEKDVKKMTWYYRNEKIPPQPPYTVFDEHKIYRFQHNKQKRKVRGSWVPNWEVSRSNYLTLMTGYGDKDEFEKSDEVKAEIKKKNKEIKSEVLEKLEAKKD